MKREIASRSHSWKDTAHRVAYILCDAIRCLSTVSPDRLSQICLDVLFLQTEAQAELDEAIYLHLHLCLHVKSPSFIFKVQLDDVAYISYC